MYGKGYIIKIAYDNIYIVKRGYIDSSKFQVTKQAKVIYKNEKCLYYKNLHSRARKDRLCPSVSEKMVVNPFKLF